MYVIIYYTSKGGFKFEKTTFNSHAVMVYITYWMWQDGG
jgi:hypothetical protein